MNNLTFFSSRPLSKKSTLAASQDAKFPLHTHPEFIPILILLRASQFQFLLVKQYRADVRNKGGHLHHNTVSYDIFQGDHGDGGEG